MTRLSFAMRPLALVQLPLSRGSIHCVNQVSERKERDAQDGAQQLEIMANAVLRSPTHARKNTKSFKHVSENHGDQSRCQRTAKTRTCSSFVQKWSLRR